ncbi:MAG: zf-HC2 domain-containing protein [Candidatus Eisenbacteria bacterium]|uniref:Zf-HC2 domain-containing protein n=1 Tax=Eiseniibacteriota bacterium TaxID=2212470 RepID=A0A948RTV2_UNCEI|nr:zf-HC2 domain-containing protein [Candidatus Eisenbacteria bacterium]MBU1950986.1 zf-HC2 domain-containing protein [Candidatus Eisenbacteria bacterium]MBU2690905.1 zf-HC2 domain-containing protein [Candidatus Eisenbacteria bacterium]
MDCAAFEKILDRLLGDRLSHAEDQAAREHMVECEHCREVYRLFKTEPDLLSDETQAELTGAILEQTTGSPCRRLEELLCDHIEGNLDPTNEELVAHHLERCDNCTLLKNILANLSEDLRSMAEIQPDSRFVMDVLDRTIYKPSLKSRVTGTVTGAVSGWWSRQIRRPRFPLEVAYSFAMILFILFNIFGFPFEGNSDPAARAGTNPIESVSQAWQANEPARGRIADFGGSVWERTGVPLAKETGNLWDAFVETGDKLLDTASIGGSYAGKAGVSVIKGNFIETWQHITEMKKTISQRWKGIEKDKEESTEP